MTTDLYSIGLQDKDRINDKLGGGIPEGSIMVIEGEYGAGKSVLTQRISHGLCDEGYLTSLLSTELTSRKFVQQMTSLGYDPVGHLLNEKLFYVKVDVNSGEDLISDLVTAKTVWEGDVVIIDTFDSMLTNDPVFNEKSEDGKREIVLDLISFFKEVISQKGPSDKEKLVIITIDPTRLSERVLSPIREMVGLHTEIDTSEVGQEVRRELRINRFSGMSDRVDDKIGFSVRPGTGVVIETSTIA